MHYIESQSTLIDAFTLKKTTNKKQSKYYTERSMDYEIQYD